VESVGDRGIVLLGRREDNGQKVMVYINDFCPYFYVLENDKHVTGPDILGYETGNWHSIDGRKLKKVYVKSHNVVPKVRKLFKETFEADVVYSLRARIDMGIREGFEIPDELLKGNPISVSWKQVRGY